MKLELISELSAFLNMSGCIDGSGDFQWAWDGDYGVMACFSEGTLWYRPCATYKHEFQVVYHYLTGIVNNYSTLFPNGLQELASKESR